MRHSLYWDDFNRRIDETVDALNNNRTPTVRRVAVFITNKCNFRCDYCNDPHKKDALSKEDFVNLVEKYGKTAIIHITGGEPSVVPWLYKFIEENGDKYRFHFNYYINMFKFILGLLKRKFLSSEFIKIIFIN